MGLCSMRYQLAFNKPPSGLFRVTACPVGSSAQPITCHYRNDEAFLRLIDRAHLAPDEYARLVFATMVAVTSPDTPNSCEEVFLDTQQLTILQLTAPRQQVA
jgi:hypothetical protein